MYGNEISLFATYNSKRNVSYRNAVRSSVKMKKKNFIYWPYNVLYYKLTRFITF